MQLRGQLSIQVSPTRVTKDITYLTNLKALLHTVCFLESHRHVGHAESRGTECHLSETNTGQTGRRHPMAWRRPRERVARGAQKFSPKRPLWGVYMYTFVYIILIYIYINVYKHYIYVYTYMYTYTYTDMYICNL